jgi:hypothetical protein
MCTQAQGSWRKARTDCSGIREAADGGTEIYLNVLPIDITATLLRGSKNGGVNYPTEHLTDSFTPINTPIIHPPIKWGTLPRPSLPPDP